MICSNHISMLDPVLIAVGIKRRIFFMAKSEFFTDKGFFVKWFMKSAGAFPVKRNTCDINSVSNAISILSSENQVGIFPQGKIVNDESFDMKSGAALLAVKTQSPILPVSIYKEGKIKIFSKITVRFGKPIYPSCKEGKISIKQARFLTEKIKEQIIAQLKEEHYCQ